MHLPQCKAKHKDMVLPPGYLPGSFKGRNIVSQIIMIVNNVSIIRMFRKNTHKFKPGVVDHCFHLCSITLYILGCSKACTEFQR